MDNLAGTTAVVTGAASGIGLGIATALARKGANVMMCDIDADTLATEADALRAEGARIATMTVDVSLRADIEALATATIAAFGKIHILVSNAGVVSPAQYGTWTDTTWDWVIGVNLRSVIWGFEIFGPLIEQHGAGGHIVATASNAGLVAGSFATYSVTKYGVVALCEGLRAPLAARGIGVSALCPGVVRTRIHHSGHALPDRFADAVTEWPTQGAAAQSYEIASRGMAEMGIDPLDVGFLVCDAILGDWDYIMTDTETQARVDQRFDAIKAAYHRVETWSHDHSAAKTRNSESMP